MSTPTPEIDRLNPVPETVTLQSGLKVDLQRLKLRQLFKLLRIITRGGAQYLPMLREAFVEADDEARSEAVGVQLMAISLIALPEAENEACEFLRSVVEPHGMPEGKDKATRAVQEQMYDALNRELMNPELEDTMTILEGVINREKGDLAALGKRIGTAITMMGKTGQLEEPKKESETPSATPTEPTKLSSVPLPEFVTSSPVSTDGPTSKS